MQKRRRVMLYRKIYGDNYFTKICNDLTIPYHTIIHNNIALFSYRTLSQGQDSAPVWAWREKQACMTV